MSRTGFVALCLGLAACAAEPIALTTDTDAPVGLDGVLPTGDWGGDGYTLAIADDGSGWLHAICGGGRIDENPVRADAGQLSLHFTYRASHPYGTTFPESPATLVGFVDATQIAGTLTIDGEAEGVILAYGEEGFTQACQ